MKREFGKKLIEQFFPTVHLTHLIDTSGAFIPGHGTPTVILVGRNHVARRNDMIRAVLGVRGEPCAAGGSGQGLGLDVDRCAVRPARLGRQLGHGRRPRAIAIDQHPWSLGGGGASDLLQIIEATQGRLSQRALSLGISCFTLEDEVYVATPRAFGARGIAECLP